MTIIDLYKILNIKVSDYYTFEDKYKSLPKNVYLITHGVYAPEFDVIALNPLRDHDCTFTLAHELIHWTGHSSRLNRAAIKALEKGKAHSDLIVRDTEELIANMGALRLLDYLGIKRKCIDKEFSESMQYCLKGDYEIALFEANRAFRYLLERMRE